MIAVFTRYQKDYKELEMTPKKMFVRIRSTNDIRGRNFSGVVRAYDWYRGEREILEAYDYLRVRQPEIFD
jgi:hypothetical protein